MRMMHLTIGLQVVLALQATVKHQLDDGRGLTKLLGTVQHLTQQAALPAQSSPVSALYTVEALDLRIDEL